MMPVSWVPPTSLIFILGLYVQHPVPVSFAPVCALSLTPNGISL